MVYGMLGNQPINPHFGNFRVLISSIFPCNVKPVLKMVQSF